MDMLLENWRDDFLMAGGILAVLGWLIAGWCWRPKLPILPRLLIAFLGTATAMLLLGSAMALYVSLPVIPEGNLLPALANDFVGTVSAFMELGSETIILWLPVVILRLLLLTLVRPRSVS